MKRLSILLTIMLHCAVACMAHDTSIAGLAPIDNCGRKVWNFNLGWKFHRGDIQGAEAVKFDDSQWQTVSTPHTVQLTPAEDSGGRNYQGIAWYRKTFVLPAYSAGASIVHFEAIMGKQKFYVNGKLVKEHEGGYLPVNINLSEAGVKPGDKAVIAVMADNSNDKTYPPGKPQYTLDFCYHGGIYRDVWLIQRPAVFITDNIDEGKVAGGGIFVHYANISEKSAEVYVNTDLRNSLSTPQTVTLQNTLTDATGKKVKQWQSKVTIPANSSKTVIQGSKISNPQLWSPERPYLYTITTRVLGKQVAQSDGGKTAIGIRSFEFRGKDGFWLNGKRYRQFVGANRHQDFAYVGNAMPNSQQRRDVQRLKDAGFNIIRTAHYPQDPSFMDACDELGIFIIVATPGWQYWNKDPQFAVKVQQNTRDIVRRDRNHPCVLMWEPILNETRFPEDFALEALKVTRDEYPYPYRPIAAADIHSAGVLDNYDLVYAWPGDDEKAVDEAVKSQRPGPISQSVAENAEEKCLKLNKNMLTREFGEYVDDWYAHNNLNRASRSWGEVPMLMQALTLSNTTADMHRTNGYFLGGCLWHPFDHQRGYHPDPYWGGIYDAFRQPKTAYYMFHSQIPAKEDSAFVYIANEMTQFSPDDVVVFSNCDSVRLTAFEGASITLPVKHEKVLKDMGEDTVNPYSEAMRNDAVAPYNAPVVFKDVWNFWKGRSLSYKPKNWQGVSLVAEGIIDGKVVTTTKRMPSRRSTKLRLYADERDRQLVADGSDFIVVVCEVTDDSGNVRRLAKEQIHFTVEGPAEIIGEGTSIAANPRQTEWGSAPILLRSTKTAGTIKIHADVTFPGTHSPTPADLELVSVPASLPFVEGTATAASAAASAVTAKSGNTAVTLSQAEKDRLLQEVQDQQADFGTVK